MRPHLQNHVGIPVAEQRPVTTNRFDRMQPETIGLRLRDIVSLYIIRMYTMSTHFAYTKRVNYLSNKNPGRHRQTDGQIDTRTDRQTDRQTNKQTDGNGRSISSYSRDHERSRKSKSRESIDGLDYNTSFAYAREVKR